MKVGSLVECVMPNNQYWGPIPNTSDCEDKISPVNGTRAFVTDIEILDGEVYLYLTGFLDSYYAECFREIQFPDNLESEIKECLTRELVTK